MQTHFVDLVKIAGVSIVIALTWVGSVAFVYWDHHRRGLDAKNVLSWAALTAVLPIVGFTVYVSYRLITRFFPPKTIHMDREPKRETALKRPLEAMVPKPTILVSDPVTESVPFVPNERIRSIDHQAVANRWVLALTEGKDQGKVFSLDNFPIRIGRNPECAVRLVGDLGVSRLHAEIYRREGALWIRDMNSTHGTEVNGRLITEQALMPGDLICVGQTTLQVKQGGK